MSTLYVDNLEPNLGSRVLAAGHVVQVVNSYYDTSVTLSSTGSAVETGVYASITPTSTSSKVLILVSQQIQANGTTYGHVVLRRGTLASNTSLVMMNAVAGYTNSADNSVDIISTNYLDSPSSTSSTRYFVTMEMISGSTLYANTSSAGGLSKSTITLMEIAQ